MRVSSNPIPNQVRVSQARLGLGQAFLGVELDHLSHLALGEVGELCDAGAAWGGCMGLGGAGTHLS